VEKIVLIEIQGLGRAGDPFGEHEGKRIFVEGAPKEAKWVIAEITSLRERFGLATCIGAFQSLEEARGRCRIRFHINQPLILARAHQ